MMGILDKIFGSKVDSDTPLVDTGVADFYTALSMQLRGDSDQALAAYRRIAEETPDKPLATFFAASVLAGESDVAGAAQLMRDLSQRIASGGETISRAVTGEIFTLLNEEPTLNGPSVAEMIVNFGDMLKQEGFTQESAVCFEISTGLLPEHASVLYRLGDTLHDLRIYDYAESVLRKALELAPNHWDSLYTYAVLLQDLGRLDEAIQYYEKAISLFPDHVKCQNNFGAALMFAGRLDEALEHCSHAAELDSEFPFAMVNLGNIHLLKKEYDEARDCFNRAIELDGNIAPAFFGLGAVEQSCGGSVERAKELYLKAIELEPSNPQFHQALGDLLATEVKPA